MTQENDHSLCTHNTAYIWGRVHSNATEHQKRVDQKSSILSRMPLRHHTSSWCFFLYKLQGHEQIAELRASVQEKRQEKKNL